jgi:hypothetical protein
MANQLGRSVDVGQAFGMDDLWDCVIVVDITGQTPQVAAAIAARSATAAAVVQSLASDEFGLPFPDWRQHDNA